MVRKNHFSGKGGTRLIISCNPIFANPPIVPKSCSSSFSNLLTKKRKMCKAIRDSVRAMKSMDMLTCVQPLSTYLVRVDRTGSSAENKARDFRARTVEMVANQIDPKHGSKIVSCS